MMKKYGLKFHGPIAYSKMLIVIIQFHASRDCLNDNQVQDSITYKFRVNFILAFSLSFDICTVALSTTQGMLHTLRDLHFKSTSDFLEVMESPVAFSGDIMLGRNGLPDNTYRCSHKSIRNFLVCCQISLRKPHGRGLHICVKSFEYRSRPRVGIQTVHPDL